MEFILVTLGQAWSIMYFMQLILRTSRLSSYLHAESPVLVRFTPTPS